jgi:hypothetical protein
MKKMTVAELQARMEADHEAHLLISYRLFEALAAVDMQGAKRLLALLQQPDQGHVSTAHEQRVAGRVEMFAKLGQQAVALREAAEQMREAVARAKNPERGK